MIEGIQVADLIGDVSGGVATGNYILTLCDLEELTALPLLRLLLGAEEEDDVKQAMLQLSVEDKVAMRTTLNKFKIENPQRADHDVVHSIEFLESVLSEALIDQG